MPSKYTPGWVATFTGHKCGDPLKQPFGWNVYGPEDGAPPLATAWGQTEDEAKSRAHLIASAVNGYVARHRSGRTIREFS
jgi:hypothetical protein